MQPSANVWVFIYTRLRFNVANLKFAFRVIQSYRIVMLFTLDLSILKYAVCNRNYA